MVYSFCEEEGEELSGFDGLVVYFLRIYQEIVLIWINKWY